MAYAIGLPPVAVVAVSAWLFPLSGVQPMAWNSAILPTVAGLTAALLFPRDWRVLRVLGWIYLVAVQLAWLVPSPVGTNVGRLGLIFTLVGLAIVVAERGTAWTTSLAARTVGRRTTVGLIAASLITLTSWQVATAAQDAISTAPPESFSVDLDPLVDQLQARGAGLGRVEMVPTASHRESTALASYVNLARGWNRQADASRNGLFYRDRPLTADAYQHWLRRWAVRFVVLSEAAPDAAAKEEAALVAGGLPYLERVWSDAEWTLYEVQDPKPLASSPAEVLGFGAAQVTVYTPTAARIVIRIGYSRWLSLVDAEGKPLPGPAGGRHVSAAVPVRAGRRPHDREPTGELAGPARAARGRLPDRGAVQDAARLRLPRPRLRPGYRRRCSSSARSARFSLSRASTASTPARLSPSASRSEMWWISAMSSAL